MQYIRVIRRERKKVQSLTSHIFDCPKRRTPQMKLTYSFYDFDPEQKREYEELCTPLPFPVDSNEPPATPYSTLETISSHSAQTSADILKLLEKKTLSRMLTAVTRPATNTSSGNLTQIRGGRPARLPPPSSSNKQIMRLPIRC